MLDVKTKPGLETSWVSTSLCPKGYLNLSTMNVSVQDSTMNLDSEGNATVL